MNHLVLYLSNIVLVGDFHRISLRTIWLDIVI